MASAPERTVVIGPFPFRIEPEEAHSYRVAVGMPGSRVPACIAARALTSDAVLPALKDLLGTRIPMHHGQDMAIEQPLLTGIDYACEVHLTEISGTGLRLEQQLRDSDGHLCIRLTSIIGLVRS